MNSTEFSKIVHETKGVVLGAIEKHLPERFYHAIDDVVQETYLRAYKSLTKDKFRGDSEISSWLYVIAKNETFRIVKKLAREEEKFSKSLDKMLSADEILQKEKDKQNLQENIEKLKIAVSKLPEKYRVVMELTIEGLKEEEISKKLNIKKGTVKSRKSRAKDIITKLLSEEERNV